MVSGDIAVVEVEDLDRYNGRSDNIQCSGSGSGSAAAAGIKAAGREERASTILGRRAASLSTAISDETKIVMVGGYNSGAGSKAVGIDIGIELGVVRFRKAHIVSRMGYNSISIVVTPIATHSSGSIISKGRSLQLSNWYSTFIPLAQYWLDVSVCLHYDSDGANDDKLKQTPNDLFSPPPQPVDTNPQPFTWCTFL